MLFPKPYNFILNLAQINAATANYTLSVADNY